MSPQPLFGRRGWSRVDLASHIVNSLEHPSDGMSKSLHELLHSDAILRRDGFQHQGTWTDFLAGCRIEREGGDAQQSEGRDSWARGWQSEAMSARATTEYRTLWERLDRSSRALLLSQSGPMASKVLTVFPCHAETTLSNHHFRTILLRRLRMPLGLSETHCRCRGALDELGDHRAACATVGILGPRGVPLEKIAARICREAGARVSTNTYLRDLNLDSVRCGERRLEVIANGLPLFHGAQLAVDTTLVCPIKRNGQPQTNTDTVPGAWLAEARRRKNATYPELVNGRRCRLIVLAAEVGGRWSEEAATFLRLLARARARAAPEGLRAGTAKAFLSRWSGFLAVTAQRAFAASLWGEPLAGTACVDGAAPDLSEVLDDSRQEVAPEPSRLPCR